MTKDAGGHGHGLELDHQGRPVAYAHGKVRFHGVDLLAAPGALVPRKETELLARHAIDRARHAAREHGRVRVIDMCCGAGNLACAIATHVPEAHVWASDLTDGAVDVARRNVAQLGLAERVRVEQGDLFASLDHAPLASSIDIIVCNPPYISSGKLASDRAFLLEHEPREAFDGGPYGLSIHQRVVKEAVPFLKPSGHLLFEIGAGQHKQLQLLFDRARAYSAPELVEDGSGVVRVVVAKKE
jgi:release factor glutamine methyltransferase